MDRKLNRAEVLGLAAVEGRVQQTHAALIQAQRERDEALRSVGLEPGMTYSIGADGSVEETIPAGET